MHVEEKAQGTLAELIKGKYGCEVIIPGYLEEIQIVSGASPITVSHEQLAHPKVDWDFLTDDIENKWRVFKQKLGTLEERPWVEQTELRERMERFNYELTKLITGM